MQIRTHDLCNGQQARDVSRRLSRVRPKQASVRTKLGFCPYREVVDRGRKNFPVNRRNSCHLIPNP